MAKDSKELKKKIQGYSNAMNAAEYEAALDQYYTNKRNEENIAELKDKSAVRQWEENEKIRQLKIASATDQFDKSQKTYETTLDAIDMSARDAEDRVRLGLDEQIAEFAFQYDDLERDMVKASMDAGLQYDQKEQSLEAARISDMTAKETYKLERNLKTAEYKYQNKENRLDNKNVKQDLKQNKLQIKSTQEDITQNKISKKQGLTSYRENQIQLTLENIKARGAVRARGQQGKSVQRAVKTSVALEGINQQTLSDNLYYSQSTMDSQRKQLGFQKKTQKSQRKQIRNKKRSVGNKKKLIKANKRADLGTGKFKINKGGKYSAVKARKKGGRLGLQLSSSKKTSKLEKKGLKAEQDYISKSLGITSEEFNMSREKLAESLQSAGANATLKLKNITTKEFEAKGQAYAQKMVAPRFGDSQPVPFKTPRTEYVMPQPAPKTPMMSGSMGRGMNRPASGASTALGIGSSVLGVAAAIPGPHTPFAAAGAGILAGISKLFG